MYIPYSYSVIFSFTNIFVFVFFQKKIISVTLVEAEFGKTQPSSTRKEIITKSKAKIKKGSAKTMSMRSFLAKKNIEIEGRKLNLRATDVKVEPQAHDSKNNQISLKNGLMGEIL